MDNTVVPPRDSEFVEKTPDVESLTNFKSVANEEVQKFIMTSNSKSSVLDPLPTSLVKACIEILIPLITLIINLSLEQGCFPSEWKLAAIIPLIKKLGLELIFKSFRPVSNIYFLSKISEEVVAQQFVQHMSLNKLFILMRSAYRDGHST